MQSKLYRDLLLLTGLLLAIASSNGSWAQGRPDIVWMSAGHSGAVNGVAWSADGTLLASGSDDRTVKLWQSADGTLAGTLTGMDSVETIAFSPDSQILAAGGRTTGEVQLWRVSDGTRIRSIHSDRPQVVSIAFSPDGQTLAAGSTREFEFTGYSVELFRVTDGHRINLLSVTAGKLKSIAFAPDGQTVAAGIEQHVSPYLFGQVDLWSIPDGTLLATFTDQDPVFSVAFAHDGTVLASANGTRATLRSLPDGTVLQTFSATSAVWSVAFAPDGQTLATGSFDQTIRLWSVPDGTLLQSFPGQEGAVLSMAFSPDGAVIASGMWYPSYAVKLWQVSDATLLRTVTRLNKGVLSVRTTPDRQRVAAPCAFNSIIPIWLASDGTEVGALPGPFPETSEIDISPDGQLLAAGGRASDTNLRWWRISDGTLLHGVIAHSDSTVSVAFSPDGTLLASGGGFTDSRIRLWSVVDGSLVRTISTLGGPNVPVRFSPDGQVIAVSIEGGCCGFWRVSDGAFLGTLNSHDVVSTFGFSPDGALMAVGGFGGVDVWSLPDRTLVRHLTGSELVLSVAFSPDGETVAAGGLDHSRQFGVLRFWRTSDGALLQQYDRDTATGVTALTFLPDGCSIVYGRNDAVVVFARNPLAFCSTGDRN